MKIAILSDSSSDLKERDQKNLFILPLPIIFPNGKEFLNDLKTEAVSELILNHVDYVALKTSSLNPGIIEFTLEHILKKFDHIIYLPIAYNLSGQYQLSLNFLNQNEKLKQQVTIVKHYFTGVQLGLFIKYLTKKIETISDIKKINIPEEVIYWAKTSMLTVIPGDIKILARGGRVNKLVAKILNSRDLKIAITWSENPKRLAISKTYNKIISKYISLCEKKFKNKENLIVYLAHTPKCNLAIIDEIKNKLVMENIKVKTTSLPLIFAVHGGNNTIGLCAFQSDTIDL